MRLVVSISCVYNFFFFSSRRRHTRFDCDWSSDVCSSDLSQALAGAIAKGYPEPDPREDLSGMDVARKALILGRLLGFSGELDDIAVESLVPDGTGRLKPDRFLGSLGQFDAAWAKRVAAAR